VANIPTFDGKKIPKINFKEIINNIPKIDLNKISQIDFKSLPNELIHKNWIKAGCLFVISKSA